MSERRGDWIQTFTGRQFWPCDPRPEEIFIEDIAHSLALQCRFAGHCAAFYSVAQHSVLVSRQVPARLALWGLLHDASEAYLTDLTRPLKRSTALGAEYRLIEAVVMKVVCERFGLSQEEPAAVKRADKMLLMTEKRDFMRAGSAPEWAEQQKPLIERIFALDWRAAERAFLDRFEELGRV